jgi:hypothetical protein
MLIVARFVGSLAILLWGLGMLLLGLVNGVALWIILGVVITVVGLPFLAGHPAAASRLYPRRGAIDPSAAQGSMPS